jgi:hypothetical protein
MTDQSLADAVRERVRQLQGEGKYRYSRRSRVMPWGDNHAVAAAMLEIADVLDEWSREGEYKNKIQDKEIK